MASWLARSIADSLRLDDDPLGQQDQYEEDGPRPDSDGDDRSEAAVPDRSSTSHRDGDGPMESSEEAHARGVKEDLEELKQSLSRQLWGVSNFIAPPPSSSVSPLDAWDREDAVEEESGEENDEEEEELVVVGVTEEVLNFASNIGMHPETWLDFPLDPDEDLDDFEMSEAQQEHVLAIESFSPRLRALRIELCPCHMSESYFWKVYFVLLHSRLDKHDSEILSTPQVMEARTLWMQELHKQTKMESDWLGRSIYHMKTYSDTLGEDFPSSPSYTHSGGLPFKSFDFETVKSSMSRYSDSERCLSLSSETQIMGESAVEENSAADTKDNDPPPVSLSNIHVQKFEDEEDDVWPEDEDSHLVGYNLGIIPVGSEEDISFSDLEDDEDVTIPIKSKPPPDELQGNIS